MSVNHREDAQDDHAFSSVRELTPRCRLLADLDAACLPWSGLADKPEGTGVDFIIPEDIWISLWPSAPYNVNLANQIGKLKKEGSRFVLRYDGVAIFTFEKDEEVSSFQIRPLPRGYNL